MKVRMKGNKLEDAQVEFISLVDRGANRIPFRITKAEKYKEHGMNLAKVFKGAMGGKSKKQGTPAVITAYVIPKTDHLEVMKTALEKAGVDIDQMEEMQDGTVLFKQEGYEEDDADAHPVSVGEGVAIILKGFDPYASQAASYTDVLKSQGFLPSLAMANEALYTTIMGTLQDPKVTGDTLVTKMESTLDEYKNYVLGLCKDVPSIAFKAESMVAEAVAEAVVKADAKSKERTPTGGEPKGKGQDKNKDALGKGKDKGGVKERKQKDEDEDEDDEEEKDTKQPKLDEKVLAQLVTKSVSSLIKPISDSVDKLSTSVSEIKDKVDELEESVEEATTTAKKAEKALRGTVRGDAQDDIEDTEEEATRAKKQDGEMGPIDTAFQNVRKKDRTYNDRVRAAQSKV